MIGSLDRAWRPGDRLYVSRVAQFPLRYYAECRACDGFSPGRDDLRTLVLSSRRQGRFALSSKPPRLIVGNVSNGSPSDVYLSDFSRLRGLRVWVLFSSGWDDSFARSALDCRGRQLATYRAFRAVAYLYDFRGAARASGDCPRSELAPPAHG